MRRGAGVMLTVLAFVVAIGIGVGAYHWGYDQGLTANGSVQVVREVGWHAGWGFFPFGLFLFPLFLFAIFALVRGAFWGRHWGDHDHGPAGPGGGAGWGARRQLFEDWHRRQHEQATGEGGAAGGEPSGT